MLPLLQSLGQRKIHISKYYIVTMRYMASHLSLLIQFFVMTMYLFAILFYLRWACNPLYFPWALCMRFAKESCSPFVSQQCLNLKFKCLMIHWSFVLWLIIQKNIFFYNKDRYFWYNGSFQLCLLLTVFDPCSKFKREIQKRCKLKACKISRNLKS